MVTLASKLHREQGDLPKCKSTSNHTTSTCRTLTGYQCFTLQSPIHWVYPNNLGYVTFDTSKITLCHFVAHYYVHLSWKLVYIFEISIFEQRIASDYI